MIDQSVNVTYTADTSQYTASMGEMITATARYGQVADGLAGRISKVGAAVTKTAVDWATFGKGMNVATQTAAAYQQQMSALEARTVVAGGNFNKLGKEVRQLARDMPGGMTNAIQQVDALAKMGITAKQNLVPLARTMSEIGAANGELGAQLTSSFAQLNRTFKSLDVTGVERIGASLTKVASDTGASATGITEFSNAIAPLSSTLGMTKTQVLGFSAAFSRSGQDGYLAANMYNKMLGDMERSAREGTGELTIYAQTVGKTTDEFRRLVKSNPGEAMTQVFESLSKGGSESIRTFERLGFEGPRAMKTLTAVAQSGGVREAITSATAGYAGDSTKKGAEAAFGGLNDELSKTQESMTQLVEASGRPVLGFLTNVTKAANAVASAFAGIAGSDFVQKLAALSTFGLGAGSIALRGMGALATIGGFKQLAGSLPTRMTAPLASGLGMMAAHRGAFMAGGMGLGALGMMTGSTPLATAGTLAFLLSNAQGSGIGARIKRGAQQIAGAGLNMFYTEPFLNARQSWRDAFTGKSISNAWGGDKTFGKRMASESGIAAWRLSAMFGGDRTVVDREYNKWQRDIAGMGNTAEDVAKKQKMLSDRLKLAAEDVNPMKARGRQLIPAAGNALAAAGGQAASLAAGFLTSPVGIAVGGLAAAGAGYGLWSSYKSKTKQFEDPSFSLAQRLSEQYGIALAPMTDFTAELQRSVKAVSTWNKAVNISGQRASMLTSMYASGETDQVKFKVGSKESVEEVLAALQLAGNAQSPAFVSQLINDIALQRGVGFAQNVATQFNGTQMSVPAITNAMGMYSGRAETGYWSVTPGYTGQSENVEAVKGGLDQLRTIEQQAFQVQGLSGQYKVKLEAFDKLRENMRKEMESGHFDEKMNLEIAKYLVGEDKAQEFIDAVKNEAPAVTMTTGKEGALRTLINPLLAVRGKSLWGMTVGKWTGGDSTDDFRSKIEEEARKPVSTKEIVEAAKLMNTASKTYSEALKTGQAMNLNMTQMVSLWEEGAKSPFYKDVSAKLLPGQSAKQYLESQGVTQEQIDALAAVENPENISKQYRAVAPILGSQNPLDIPKEVMKYMSDLIRNPDLEQPGKMDSDTAKMGMLMQYGMPMAVSQMAPTQGRALKGSMGSDLLAWAAANPESPLSPQATETGLQWQVEQVTQNREQLLQMHQATFNYQKQEARAWEDYYMERAWAQEDFDQSQQWAQEDYYRQRRYAMEDYHRSARYAEEDFNRQMKYMAEDNAKQMVNPWERLQVVSVWSMTAIRQNLKEQNDYLQRQMETLDTLKERGLKQSTIDTLGLADPTKAQQVSFMGLSSEEDIRKLNRQASRTRKLGQEYTDSENNVQTRRYVEGYQRQMERQTEGLNVQLRRMEESFETSSERAAIQFAKQMSRMQQKMAKSMARSFQDLKDSFKEVSASNDKLIEDITTTLDGGTAQWTSSFSSALKSIEKQNHKGWNTVGKDSHEVILYIEGEWRKFSLDGTVPKGSNPFSGATTSGSASTDPKSDAPAPSTKGTNKSARNNAARTTQKDSGKNDRKASALGTDTPPVKPVDWGGKGGGPVSGAGGTGDWGQDLKAKYTALTDSLIKYGPLNKIGFSKGSNMKTGGAKAAAWLWQQMLADGLTKEQAAGILGNLDQESGFNPGSDQPDGPGMGIAQWSQGARWDQLLAFAKANDMDPKMLGTQYAFMKFEMDNSAYKFKWSDFNQKKTVQDAASYFGTNYEGYGIEGDRNQAADFWYKKLKDLGPSMKESDKQWDSAGLWAIGDEIDRKGKAYQKLLKQIQNERNQMQGEGPTSPVKYGMTHGDLEVPEGSWGPPVNGLSPSADGGPAIDFGAGPGNNPPIFAVFDGTVHSMTWPPFQNNAADGSYGNTIVLRSPKGIWYARYAHLMAGKPYAPGLKVGAQVKAGQHLGWVGTTGHSSGEHLHFEINKGSVPREQNNVNPFTVLAEHGVRLALGGVATKPTKALIAEAGSSEAVIPLNGQGVSAIAEAIGKYAMTYEAKVARTAQHGTPTVTSQTYIQDYSNQFHGDIHVEAQDPEEMAYKLEQRQRRRNTYALSGRRGR